MSQPHRAIKLLLIVLIILTAISILLNMFHPKDNFDLKFREAIASINPVQGKKGDKADSVTQDQLDVAVAAYMRSHPITPIPGAVGATGSMGEQGIPGLSILGPIGPTGARGTSCTTISADEGANITCTDGTSSFVPNGAVGSDGKTPFLRCNIDKNQWEVRYNMDDNWELLNNEVVACKGVPT